MPFGWWEFLWASALGWGIAGALVAFVAIVILRTPELLLVAYSWLKVDKMDGSERPAGTFSGRSLHRPQWEEDTVYLVQWPASPYVRSISPFALKVIFLTSQTRSFSCPMYRIRSRIYLLLQSCYPILADFRYP